MFVLEKNVIFFKEINTMFNDSKTINTEKIIKILPVELNTHAKIKFLKAFGETVNKKQYIKFLRYMTHGGDHISIDTLIKAYKLQINPQTQMIIFNDKLRYKDILQEALYIWYMLRLIKQDTFISGCTQMLDIIRQNTIEEDILPANCNFKFDFGFPSLNILCEINEYAHEISDNMRHDDVKNCLTVLCGYTTITLKVKDVFNMDEKMYNKLSDTDLHNTLATSEYLQLFAQQFTQKITAALLKFKNIRDDYIMILFKQMLQQRIYNISARIKNNTNKITSIHNAIKSLNYTDSNLEQYKNITTLIEIDKTTIYKYQTDLSSLSTNQDFINLFNIKHKCAVSDTANIITFAEVVELLKVGTSNYNSFKLFLYKYIAHIDLENIADNIKITWEDLSEIIDNYSNDSNLSHILKMYYREVGRSYEIIIKMIKSHTDLLQTNQDVLTTYTNYVQAKNLSTIKNLKQTIAANTIDKKQTAADADKIITKLQKQLYNVTKYDAKINITKREEPIIEEIAIPEHIECDAVKEIMLNFEQNLHITQVTYDSDDTVDSDSELSD